MPAPIFTSDFLDRIRRPQGQDERGIVYEARKAFAAPAALGGNIGASVGAAIHSTAQSMFETPRQKQEREQGSIIGPAAGENAGATAAAAFRTDRGSLPPDLVQGLVRRGIPQHVALGSTAGIIGESRGDHNAVNPTSGAYGLGQWLGPRQQELFSRYGSQPTREQQLDFLAYELKGGDHGGAAVLAAKDPVSALDAYTRAFMRPAAGAETQGTLSRGMAALQGANEAMLGRDTWYGKQPGTLTNPFDPSYLNAAGAQIDEANKLALQPVQVKRPGEPMPTLPEIEPSPKTDFSGADAALETLRPVEMTIKQERDIHWKNFWGSLGQAMASSPEGEGLGSFLLRLGGAALAAKGQTGDEVMARRDAYDAKLAKFQAATYEHNFQKAQVMQNELQNDWSANQQRTNQQFQLNLALWQNNNKMDISADGSKITTQSIDPKTGERTVNVIPIASVINSQFAAQRANLMLQGFGTQNSANATVTGISNRVQGQLVQMQAAQVLADATAAPAEKAAAAAMGPMPAISHVVETGQIPAVIGQENYEAMNEEIVTQLNASGFVYGSKEFVQAKREAEIGRMIMVTQDPATLSRLLNSYGPAANLYDTYKLYEGRKERITTKDKRTGYSRSITYEEDE